MGWEGRGHENFLERKKEKNLEARVEKMTHVLIE
jgi:hypothetical protein